MLCVKTAMLAHSRGNLISISWAKNLSPAFSRFLLKSESYAGIGFSIGCLKIFWVKMQIRQ
jgi:hypothetical protein